MKVETFQQFFSLLHKAWQSAEDCGHYYNDEYLCQQYVDCANLIDFCMLHGSEIKNEIDDLYTKNRKASTNDNPT